MNSAHTRSGRSSSARGALGVSLLAVATCALGAGAIAHASGADSPADDLRSAADASVAAGSSSGTARMAPLQAAEEEQATPVSQQDEAAPVEGLEAIVDRSGEDDESAADPDLSDADAASAADVYGPPSDRVVIAYPDGIPEDLARGVAMALDDYPAIRAARLQEEAASQEVRAAKGQRLPSVTVDGQGLGGGTAIVEDQDLALNVTVLQPLWSGGRINAAIDRARAAREVSYAQTLETGESIAIQTINAFYQAVLAKRRMAALEEGNNQLMELVGSIERRVSQQVSPRADLTLVQSRQADIQRQYQVAQATFLSSRETYRQLTGDFDYALDNPPEYPGEEAHPQVDNALNDAETCNPLLRRLAAEAELAEAEVEVAQKELFPTVSAQLSRNEITGTRYGIVVRSQLNNGLSQFRLVDASRARQLQATTNILTAARETRVRLTEDLLLNYSTREQIPIVRTAVEAATDLTTSYRRQFVAGRRSWLDVVNAVREEISADLNLVDAETSAMASGARILIYTCRWAPAIGS